MRSKANLLWRYPGSKALLSQWHVSLFPPDVKTYVSVFGGTASEFLHRRPSGVEILNDLDKHIHDTFSVVRNPAKCTALKRLLRATPDGRQQFLECRQALNHADPVRRAWAYLVLANTGARLSEVQKRTWFNSKHSFYHLPEFLDWWCHRLRRVRLECRPWQVLLDVWDKEGSLLYCDPPYHPSTLRNIDKLYHHVLSKDEHVDLLLRLNLCRAKVLVCGYGHPTYDLILSDWVRLQKDTRCYMGNKDIRTEVVWLNYQPPAPENGGA